jgi:hypothetical protein
MRAFGIVDAVMIFVLICGTVVTASMLTSGRPDLVVVFRQNAVIARYPLGKDAAFTVSGSNGPVDIEINNGAVRIVHASCPRRVCKLSGGINTTHRQLICAPNNILVQIQSSKSGSGVDGVTY